MYITNCQQGVDRLLVMRFGKCVSSYLKITLEPADERDTLEIVIKNKIFLRYNATDYKSFNPGHDSRSWEINIFLGFRRT